jgi:phosphotransferase system enzyme I (PtsI)
MIALQGTGVSAGVASGPIRFYSRKQAVVKRVKVADAEKELARYREATDAAIAQLGELAEKTRREAGEDARAAL